MKMFNTKDIGRQVVSTYCHKCGQPTCICISKIDLVFKLWVELSQDDKVRLAEKKIKWHNDQLENK